MGYRCVPDTASQHIPNASGYGLNCVPHKFNDVLTPSILECDYLESGSLKKSNLVKMWSLGWALIQHDWYPYKIKTNTEKTM